MLQFQMLRLLFLNEADLILLLIRAVPCLFAATVPWHLLMRSSPRAIIPTFAMPTAFAS